MHAKKNNDPNYENEHTLPPPLANEETIARKYRRKYIFSVRSHSPKVHQMYEQL